MKKFIFILFYLLTLNSFGQCWQSLDVDGDTNSLHYAIQNDGTFWKLLPSGSAPVQLGFQKSWKHCYTTGNYSTFLIADDSTLWGFGSNYDGELGIGNTNNQSTLIQLNNSKWISLSSSWGHTTAIKADGTMWFWGHVWPNAAILLPTQIGTDSNWKEIHTDYSNAIALKNNGTIWFGNVGGTLSQVGSDSDWNYIWMQSDNGAWLAIKNNGTMWENGVQVGNDSDWKLVKGKNITLALKNNGSAWHWDYGDDLLTTPPILLNQNIGFKDITGSLTPSWNGIDYIYAISTSGELYKGFYNWSSVPYLSIDTSSNYLCVAALEEMSKQETGIKVYPNPSNGQMTILLEKSADNASYSIFDLEGKIVKTGTLSGKKTAINTDLNSGMYFLMIGKNVLKIQVMH